MTQEEEKLSQGRPAHSTDLKISEELERSVRGPGVAMRGRKDTWQASELEKNRQWSSPGAWVA